jgi:hypothetical protein
MAVFSTSPTFFTLDKLQLIPGNHHPAATPHIVNRWPQFKKLESIILLQIIMINKLLIIVMILLLTACSKRQSRDFTLIDYSCYADRQEDYYCLKIFNDGNAYLYNFDKIKERKYYYSLILTKSETDSISMLVKEMLIAKLDTINLFSCLSCYDFSLIIKKQYTSFRTYYSGEQYSDCGIKELDAFKKYMNRLIINLIASVDSNFVYQSWSKFLLPLPPGDVNINDSLLIKYGPDR